MSFAANGVDDLGSLLCVWLLRGSGDFSKYCYKYRSWGKEVVLSIAKYSYLIYDPI